MITAAAAARKELNGRRAYSSFSASVLFLVVRGASSSSCSSSISTSTSLGDELFLPGDDIVGLENLVVNALADEHAVLLLLVLFFLRGQDLEFDDARPDLGLGDDGWDCGTWP